MPATSVPRKSAPRRRLSPWLGTALIVLAGFAAYHRTLDAPFLFDDNPAIVENETIRDLSRFRTVLSPPSEGAGIDSRPMINLTLALNYAASGLNPRGYRLTNIALHVMGALALFGLLRRTLALPSSPERLRAQALPIAFSVALLWTVHPLQTETVICVVQRTESIVSLCWLLMFYSLVRAVEPGGNRRWLFVAWIACLLGMGSKEVMVGAPLVALLYDRTFAAGTFREAWRQRGRWHVAFAATWLLLAWLVLDSGGTRGGTSGFGQGVSAWTYLLTQARALTIYLKLSAWPHPLIVDRGGWLAPGLGTVWAEFVFVATLVGGTVFALVRHPRIGFVAASFFVILAPSSSIYPLISQTIAEHRMHLPLAAVLTLLTLVLFRLPARAALTCATLLAVVATIGTVRRGADYSSELALWTDTVAKSPSNPWARFHLGRTHFRAGRLAEAERENRAVVTLMPSHADGHYALGLALEMQARREAAADSYQKAVELKPQFFEAHFRLGVVLLHLGRPAEAIPHFSETVRLKPDYADAEGNWGAALYQLGRPAEALPHFERVVALQPDSVEARYNLALLMMQANRFEAALPHLEVAARLRPDDNEIRTNLSQVLFKLGRNEEARRVGEKQSAR